MRKIISYSIIAEEYERLLEIDRKFNELKNLIDKNNPAFITVSMIARAQGITRQDVMNRPWLMPNFGYIETPSEHKKKRFWRYDEYLDWIGIPEYERVQQYREMNF